MSVLKIGRSGKGGEIRKVAANGVLNSGVVVDFCLPVEGEKYIEDHKNIIINAME